MMSLPCCTSSSFGYAHCHRHRAPAPGSRRRRTAKLSAQRKERIKLPPTELLSSSSSSSTASVSIGDFLAQPSGVEALLNTTALQDIQHLGSDTYRCTLHKLGFLKFEVTPVLDLRVVPTNHDCMVEMLSCKFEGSKQVEQQNGIFSAFMRNHITWEGDDSEPYLDIDVNLQISLEVFTKPFSLLPISAVEKPGNLLMQGLINKLVPLLAQQLLESYSAWVEEQMELS